MLSLSNYSLVSGRAHEMSRTLCLRVVEEAGHLLRPGLEGGGAAQQGEAGAGGEGEQSQDQAVVY